MKNMNSFETYHTYIGIEQYIAAINKINEMFQ